MTRGANIIFGKPLVRKYGVKWATYGSVEDYNIYLRQNKQPTCNYLVDFNSITLIGVIRFTFKERDSHFKKNIFKMDGCFCTATHQPYVYVPKA